MQALQQEPTIEMAALKAGIDPKTARKYIKAKGKVEEKKRVHRTHKDTFEKRWPEIEAKLKITPGLQTPTILNFLIELYPTEFSLKNERSLFRRIKLWRVQHCDKNKIIFRQELFPGRQSQSDWTNMNKLKVTINGKQFNHLLFHYMLTYSRVESIMICFSESLETLTRGYEQGITETGGVAAEHRTDNLTAATQQMGNDRVFTERWSADCRHIIDGLVKKPGAFESYQHRAHLYPNVTFRRVHDVLRESGSAYCNKRYLELLQLAKMYGEQDVTLALELLMETNIVPLKKEVLSIVEARKTPQTVTVIQPNLGDYDQLHSFARGQNIALQK